MRNNGTSNGITIGKNILIMNKLIRKVKKIVMITISMIDLYNNSLIYILKEIEY